jgi:hypothetical protein
MRKGIDPVTHRRCTNLDALEQLNSLVQNRASMLMPNSFSASYLKLTAEMTQLAKMQLLQNLLQSIQPNVFHPDIGVIRSQLGHNSLLNNQFDDFTQLNHCVNMTMNVREASNLSNLNSNSKTFDPNLILPVPNRPCSFTNSRNNDGSVFSNKLGSSYMPDDYIIPPLVPVSPYNVTTTEIDPSISCSIISAVNSSSPTLSSIVSSPFEPWDVNHFLEPDEHIGLKDILD